MVFKAKYSEKKYGIPHLIFEEELSINKVLKHIFESNFLLYQKFWDAKHTGKPKSVAEYKLHKAHISLLW